MPYDPGVQDISGQLRAQGRVALAKGIGEGLQEGFLNYSKLRAADAATTGQIEGYGANGIQSLMPYLTADGQKNAQKFLDHKADLNSKTMLLGALTQAKALKEDQDKAQMQKQQTALIQQQMLASQATQKQQEFETQQGQRAAGQQAQMDARNTALAQFSQGTGAGVYSPKMQNGMRQQMAANPQAAQLAAIFQQTRDPVLVAHALAALAVQAKQPPQKYQNVGHIVAGDGTYLGSAVLDQTTGETGLMKNGKVTPLPEGAEPITATGIQKSIPNNTEFRKLKSNLTDAEISLRNMDRYITSVGDADSGITRLADKFSAGIKTVFGKSKLEPKELAAKMAQGQLQGLLGANRTNVVGGGVMTEQDALRIIERLGGDFDALSNPEVVKAAIGQVYSDRFKQYDDDFNFYNAAVNGFYGSKNNGGFKNADRLPFSHNFGDDYAGKKSAAPQTADELAAKWLKKK